jgi:hypothetical protein
MHNLRARFSFLASEYVLGALVAILSIAVAVSSYRSSMVSSEQTKYNVQGQRMLTDANAEYLSVNQLVGYDYTMYDGWYTAENEEKAQYYEEGFSTQLQAAMKVNAKRPFDNSYYAAMQAEPKAMFAEADRLFDLAEAFNERGDALQLVVLVSALGLALAAWASLLSKESWVRLIFAVISIAMLVLSFGLYLAVPSAAA